MCVLDVAAIWRCIYKHREIEKLNYVIHGALTACQREKLRKKPSTEELLGFEFLKLKNCFKIQEMEIPQFESLRTLDTI